MPGPSPKAKPPIDPAILERARALRRGQTDAEMLLWAVLRGRRFGGFKFRRQHPVRPYILDFYCHDANLAIELDGGQHNKPDERARDEERTRLIREQGIRILRLWNHELLANTDAALEAIWNALHDPALSLPSPPGRGAGGEGKSASPSDVLPHPSPLPGGEGAGALPSPSGRGAGGEGKPTKRSRSMKPGSAHPPRSSLTPALSRGERESMPAPRGGFDVVIGNPPYIRIQTMQETAPQTLEYYKRRYAAAAKGNYDIYVLFVERGLQLLNPDGRLGFILPHKFFNAQYGRPLREHLSRHRCLAHVVHFSDQQVFDGATIYTCLLFLSGSPLQTVDFARIEDLNAWRAGGEAQRAHVSAEQFTGDDWNITIGPAAALCERLAAMDCSLKDIARRMGQGIRTSANEVYVLDLIEESGDVVTALSRQLDRSVTLERALVRRFLQGRDIKPYRINPSGKVVLCPYTISDGNARLISMEDLENHYPLAYHYLRSNKSYLEARENGRFRGRSWYTYGRQQNIDLMLLTKILVPDIADRAAFSLDDNGEYAFTSGYGITLHDDVKESNKYVLGLLNSRLLDFYLKRISTILRGGYFRYFTQYIAQLPIRRIDFNDQNDVASYGRMSSLVEHMLALHKAMATARTGHDRTAIQRQIDITDRQIDELVYELYGLTDQEIRVVEESTALPVA